MFSTPLTTVPDFASHQACLTALYREHFHVVRLYLARHLGCPEAGREAAQDVFLRLLMWRGAVPLHNPRAFLLRVARNLAIDIRRGAGRGPVVEPIDDHRETLADPCSDPLRCVLARQQLRLIAQTIELLPPRCRDVFVLLRFEGMSHRAVAAHFGISTKMVEAHLARALLQLRRCWAG